MSNLITFGLVLFPTQNGLEASWLTGNNLPGFAFLLICLFWALLKVPFGYFFLGFLSKS